jgi:hypothetical protein
MCLREYLGDNEFAQHWFGNLAVGVQGHVNDHDLAGHHVLGQVLLAAAGEVDIPYPDRGLPKSSSTPARCSQPWYFSRVRHLPPAAAPPPERGGGRRDRRPGRHTRETDLSTSERGRVGGGAGLVDAPFGGDAVLAVFGAGPFSALHHQPAGIAGRAGVLGDQ